MTTIRVYANEISRNAQVRNSRSRLPQQQPSTAKAAKRQKPYVQDYTEDEGTTEYMIARDENEIVLFSAIIDHLEGTGILVSPDGQQSEVSDHTAMKFFQFWIEQSGLDFDNWTPLI
jgi:hypothetical protein